MGEGAIDVKSPEVPVKPNKDQLRSQSFNANRSWCRWCGRGKARGVAHRTECIERSYQVVSTDYIYMTNGQAGASFLLVAHDDNTNCIGVWLLPSKGGRMSVAARLVQWQIRFGHGKIIFTCDQEPALVDVQGGASEKEEEPLKRQCYIQGRYAPWRTNLKD